MRVWRAAVVMAATCAATIACTAGAASAATITPSLALSPASGVAASTQNLGTDITFSYSTSGDTVKDMTLALPAGLLANASIDGGKCISSTTLSAACQVGTGSITATATVLNLLGIQVPVTETLPAEFDLVAPPHAGDLAGLQVLASNPTDPGPGYQPLGTPADVTVRSSDAGLDIAFTGLPNTYPLNVFGLGLGTVPISVSTIDSTFDNLLFPSSCPSTPARFTVITDSYAAPSSSASAPLTVTGCGSGSYAPKFGLTAVKDTNNNEVKLTANITQAAGQLTTGTTVLAFPTNVLGPNLGVAGELCANPASGTCTPVGSATAVSPVYPTPLSGQAYLTGNSSGLELALVFPAPFSLTLTGSVNLATNTTSFTHIPDIPLSQLQVVLNGGASGAFATTCQTASGTATAKVVSQNGDITRNLSAPFTVSGWKPCTGAPPGKGNAGGGSGGSGGGSGGSGGGGSGSGGSGGGGSGSGGSAAKSSLARLSNGVVKGLLTDKPSVRFTVTKGKGKSAGKLKQLTIGLTDGLTFAAHKAHGHTTVAGVTLKGARAKSLTLSGGRLVIVLSKPATAVTVTLSDKALRESRQLHSKAKHRKLSQLGVDVTVKNAAGKSSQLQIQIHKLGLPKVKVKK
jgi:uncharacterized membrane protein YgcG